MQATYTHTIHSHLITHTNTRSGVENVSLSGQVDDELCGLLTEKMREDATKREGYGLG